MNSRNNSIWSKFGNSPVFTNLISLLAFAMSFFVLYRTELNRGELIVSSPRRIAVASADEIDSQGKDSEKNIQGNNSDKILLSYAIYNSGATLKTIRNVYLTLTDPNNQEIELQAEGQYDQLKDLQLYELALKKNENYSLITAISIPPRSSYIANHLFFYFCDLGWHSKDKNNILESCKNQSESFKLQTNVEYQAQVRVDAFEAKSQTTCFTLLIPQDIPDRDPPTLNFSPIYTIISCN